MSLLPVIRRKKNEILDRWLEIILETYPERTAQFLQGETNPFANPVGASMKACATALLDHIINTDSPEAIAASLDKFIRIQAVQDFSPSKAVAFIFFLKQALRDVLAEELSSAAAWSELHVFDSATDTVSLLAFDSYMRHREKVWSIKAGELRDRSKKFFERVSAMYPDMTGTDPDSDTDASKVSEDEISAQQGGEK